MEETKKEPLLQETPRPEAEHHEAQKPVLDQLREYAETRIKLSKYKAIEKSTSIAASVVTDVVIAVCMVLTFLFLSFTLALFLGEVVYHSNWKGFGTVGLFYLLIALVVMFAKDSFKKPIINALVKKLFNDNNDNKK
jgi:ABC-type sugar transport system permease subunit